MGLSIEVTASLCDHGVYFEGLEKKIKILSRGDGEMEFRDIYTPSLYFHYVSKSDQIFKSRILKYFRDEISSQR